MDQRKRVFNVNRIPPLRVMTRGDRPKTTTGVRIYRGETIRGVEFLRNALIPLGQPAIVVADRYCRNRGIQPFTALAGR